MQNTKTLRRLAAAQATQIERIIDRMNDLPDGKELTVVQLSQAGRAMHAQVNLFDEMRLKGLVTLEEAVFTDPIA